MMLILLLAGGIIIAGILFLGTKIFNLFFKDQLARMKVSDTTINRWLFPAFFIIGLIISTWYYLLVKDMLLPGAASAHGEVVDGLFTVTTILTGFIFLTTQSLLFYFAFRYRFNADHTPPFFYHNNRLEFIWTIIPFITFIVLFCYGQVAWENMTRPPEGKTLDIEIIGQQFTWRVRYAGADEKLGTYHHKLIDNMNVFGMDMRDTASWDDIAPLQLHIPKGIPIRFHIRSKDVIHSVFIPHFRMKMDAVPGLPTSFNLFVNYSTDEMRAKMNRPDFNYELACAELCGRMHFAMKMIVVVEESEDFFRWYKKEKSWLSQHPSYRIAGNTATLIKQEQY